VRSLEDLLQSKGWVVLTEILRKHLIVRGGDRDAPLRTHDEVYMQEYLKGYVAGVQLAIGMPAKVIESYKEEPNREPE